jgi:DNA-binding CsgD family transcriptional regulator
MWKPQGGWNPALGAPGPNNYTGLLASSTINNGGSQVCDFQGISDDEANNLCKRYLPLAYKTATKHRDRGIDEDDLLFASLAGLGLASRRYDPQRGPFGPYAKLFMKGEITALFNKKKSRKEVLVEHPIGEQEIAPPELPLVNLEGLSPTERHVAAGRAEGKTLREIGAELGFSPERARQIETRATEKLRTGKGNVARACIRELVNRRGYQKCSRQLLAFRSVKYPGRSYTPEEIAAFVAKRPDLEGSR